MIKAALNLLFVTWKYTRILQQFTEIEWLPSVGFLYSFVIVILMLIFSV